MGLATLGVGLGVGAGCSGGSLSSRQSRLAGTYDGAGLTLTVATDGAVRATFTPSGGSPLALTGLVTSSGSLSLTGTGASAQGTLNESGGTLSFLVGASRTEIAVTRRATPSPSPTPAPTATPTPTPTPSPTPDPGPHQLSASLFPRTPGDTWTFDLSVTGSPAETRLEKIGTALTENGQSVVPLEFWRDGAIEKISLLRENLTTGYGIVQERVLLPGGTITAQTTYGQPLLVSYNLIKGQQGFTATGGGERNSAGYLGPVTTTFTASFQRSERVSVPAGTFDCAVIEIVQEVGYSQGGVFQREKETRTEWRAASVGVVKKTIDTATYTLCAASVGGRSWPQ